MSSHHRSGGPPSLMDDVHDFDRNFHSHRFEGGRGGGNGGGRGRGDGMRGRGDGRGGGMRGRGGEGGGFGFRGGPRGRGDFHQRDRFQNNNNFNRPDDDQRGNGPPKMPSLFDVNQPPSSRPFDRDNNNGGGRGRMPFPRGGNRDASGDDRYRHSGSKSGSSEGAPPSLLDYPNDKPGLAGNNNGNPLPSLLSVPIDNAGGASESNKSLEPHKEHQHVDSYHSRSEHSSHRDNDNRYRDRDRDSRRSNQGDYDRSSSFSRDRSRSPRDRDRHSSSRDDRSFDGGDRRGSGRGGRGVGGDHFSRGGRAGGHQNNPRDHHQSRFGPDHHQPSWQDRRDGGRGSGGRGHFPDRPRDMGGHHRSNDQLPPDNHPYHRDGRSNFDGPPSQNRPFQESFPPSGNYDSMGPSGPNRPNFNQGPPSSRPDFYGSNNNNPSFPPHNMRSGGRPSRFSDRQDDYDDERPLTKPNLPLTNIPTTTPLYMNQSNNPTYSQARPPLASTFASQQPPSGMFPPGAQAQSGWPNQSLPGGSNPHLNPSLAANDSQNPGMSGPPSQNTFYGGNNDFHRQQTATAASSVNPYYTGVPPVSSQTVAKPPAGNSAMMGLPQVPMAVPAAANQATAAAPAGSAEALQQYYQQYWQYMQQQQQQQAGIQSSVNPLSTQQPFAQAQTAAATTTGIKPSAYGAAASTANPQDPAAAQANAEAWAQYCMQYQAYMQHMQMTAATAATPTVPTSVATITAPSQLYSQSTGKNPSRSDAPR